MTHPSPTADPLPFATAVRRAFTHYLTFCGRARRSEFWWFALLYAAVFAVRVIVDWLTIDTALQGLGSFIVVGCFLATTPPLLAVTVRRLHDCGRSGWWCLVCLIPGFGWVLLLLFLAERTTPVTNQYGPSPTAPALPPGAWCP